MGRRRVTTMRAVLMVAVVGAGCSPHPGTAQDAVMFREGPAHAGVSAGAPLEGYGGILWRTPVRGPVRSTAAVAGDRVLVGDAGGRLLALDRLTGRELWNYEAGAAVHGSPAVLEGMVYAADAATGELHWRHATRGAELASGDFGFDRRTIQSSPAIADGRVHIGARDGWLYTLDLATGERLWDADHEVSWINGGPAVAEGRVFAGSSDGQFVHALDAATGEELWRRDSEGIVWTSPLVAGDQVIFAEGAGRIRGLDAATGETRWSTWLPHRLWASPVLAHGVLYIGTDGNGMYALRGADGHPLRRAVVWDSTLVEARWYLDHERLARWLRGRGYELLDAEGAASWLEARIRDREPSAVVFAIDHLPGPIYQGAEASTFRRYLDAGGTVVWPGYPPGLWRRDPATGSAGGLAAIDREATRRLLGVDHAAGNFDGMGAWPTDEGRRLGLPEAWRSGFDVAPAEGLEPLAVNERGELASWRKGFGGPPGTGFVRLWGSRREPPELAPFLVAAEWRPATPEEDSAGRD